MSRWRLVAGVGVVAVLALTLVVLSVRGNSSSSPSTTPPLAGPSTTAITLAPSTTTTAATTLTTTAEQRLAEVEVMLQDLWFGWFDAIYRKDPDALWEVVATTQSHDAGVAAMETMEFAAEPGGEGVHIESLEMLLERPDCLVAFYVIDVSDFRGTGSTSEHVSVLWPDEQYGFRLASSWTHPDDLWLMDCDNLERELTP